MSFNINNKIKQFFGGNWGHPRKFIKRNTNIPEDFFVDRPIKRNKKKKRKKKIVSKWNVCPFCYKELQKTSEDTLFLFKNYETFCRHCGAKEVPNCPACHHSTWYHPKSQIYKHKWLGCGFEGKRKIKGE